MKRRDLWILVLAWLSMACQGHSTSAGLKLYDLAAQEEVEHRLVTERLVGPRLLLVGEHHSNAEHHAAQLAVIRFLHDEGVQVAVGLEMFRQDGQESLDRWVAGEVDEKAFREIYLDNWNFDWRLYRDIFRFARDERLPMVGLNVSREITSQVAYHGFESLNEGQQRALGGITCNVSEDYMAFIRQAFEGHGGGAHASISQFSRFCEAQLVWDTVMANTAGAYLEAHPERVMVLIAGSGHVQRPAIPTQFEKRSSLPYRILLPETRGSFERGSMDAATADYLILGP